MTGLRAEGGEYFQSLDRGLKELLNIAGTAAGTAIEHGKITRTVMNLIQEGNRLKYEEQVLEKLDFKGRLDRASAIRKPHSNSFQWIFQHKDIFFEEWLRSEGGIYWVSGKAGCGKSTLMKYLAAHSLTRDSLEAWARGAKLILATHFFWKSGHKEQRNFQGLLQSLLHDIFKGSPETLASLQPTGDDAHDHQKPPTWNIDEIEQALKTLTQEPQSKLKFCFFIDGLDEYEGTVIDQEDLIKFCTDLASSKNVKICVSSRPDPIFRRAFGSMSSRCLEVHKLSSDDIRVYVEDVFEEHRVMSDSASSEFPHQEIASEITRRAQGVFLWVYLVVRSLISGMHRCDSPAMLQQRLDELPDGIEELFEDMLNRIESIYRKSSAQILLTMVQSLERQLSFQSIEAILRESEVQDSSLDEAVAPLSEAQVEKSYASTYTRLHARCGDLLEVIINVDYGYSKYWIGFPHRCVLDYLLLPEVGDLLRGWAEESFSPRLSLCKALVVQIKRSPFTHSNLLSEASICGAWYPTPAVSEIPFQSFIETYREFEAYTGTEHVVLLENFCKITKQIFENPLSLSGHTYLKELNENGLDLQTLREDDYLAWLVEQRLCLRLSEKLLHSEEPLASRQGRSLLQIALGPTFGKNIAQLGAVIFHTTLRCRLQFQLVLMLLNAGSDPNQPCATTGNPSLTVWGSFLQRLVNDNRVCRSRISRNYRFHERLQDETASLLLHYGADPDLMVEVSDSRVGQKIANPSDVFAEVFLPQHVASLDQKLSEARIWKQSGHKPIPKRFEDCCPFRLEGPDWNPSIIWEEN